jgi:hypothetical protein
MLDLGTWVGAVEAVKHGSTVRMPVGTAVAKRGFADVPGDVAYQGPGGESLTLTLELVPDAVYPDGGAQVEVWFQHPTIEPIAELEDLHPSADHVELEVLGPLISLGPGESTSDVITWVVAGPRL